jgi:hypothetical protein
LAAVLAGALDCDGPETNCTREAMVAKGVSYDAATWLASTVNRTSGKVAAYNYDGTVEQVSSMGAVRSHAIQMMNSRRIGFCLSRFDCFT